MHLVPNTSAEVADAQYDNLGKDRASLLAQAIRQGGYLVDSLPLMSADLEPREVHLTPEESAHLSNPRAVLEALRRAGPLSGDEYLKHLTLMGSGREEVASRNVPEIAAHLYVTDAALHTLATGGLLDVVCAHFTVFIPTDEHEVARRAVEAEEERGRLSIFVRQVLDRISDGLEDGRYCIVSVPGDTDEDDTPEERTLTDLLKYVPAPGDVIWVDDRAINAYMRRDTVPIVGVNEIIAELFARRIISEVTYYDKLAILRACNFRYIPFDERELGYHLQQANVADGELVETTALKVCRRYAAACVLDRKRLQIPPLPKGSANADGEIAFLLSIHRSAINAIAALWADKAADDNSRSARAEWILRHFHAGVFATRDLYHGPESDENARFQLGLEITGFLAQGITLHENGGQEAGSRRQYFKWLNNSILRKRLRADPEITKVSADAIKNFIMAQEPVSEPDEHRRVWTVVVGQFCRDLPEPIRTELKADPAFMECIGRKELSAVFVGRWAFDGASFWDAIASVVNGVPASVTELNSREKIAVSHGMMIHTWYCQMWNRHTTSGSNC